MSTTVHRNALGQNMKYSSLYSSSSFRFSMLCYYMAILYYCGQSVSQKIDNLTILTTCWSGTSATLSSDVKCLVVHECTQE